NLADALTAVTDHDGRFVLKGIPAGGGVFAEVTAPGFGSPRLSWTQDVPCNLRLEKAGSIRIRFEGLADPTKLAGLVLYPSRKPAPAESVVKVYEQKEITVRNGALLTIPDVVPGRYALEPRGEGRFRTPYWAEPSAEFTVPPGGVGEVTIKVTPAAEV